MQTFLTHPAFETTMAQLDYRRLGKQRVEALQILNLVVTHSPYIGSPRHQHKSPPPAPNVGWLSHPAVIMWRFHPNYLVLYGIAACDEWINRGYVDNLKPRFKMILSSIFQNPLFSLGPPTWLIVNHDNKLYVSHRANLMRKDSAHYQWMFSDALSLDPLMPYYWPQCECEVCSKYPL